MGLFINKKRHPDVYKNNTEIKAPNQEVYKQDYLSEMIERQRQANAILTNSFQELEKSFKKQSKIQSGRVTRIGNNLRELNDRYIEQRELDHDVAHSLEIYGKKSEELALKMEQQIELQEQLANQISKQENFQNEVLNRLENQEALTEKMIRKIDNFRSILYERTHYLAEKIEDGYNSTSAYIYDLVTGSNVPAVRYKLKRNEKKHE